MNFTYKAYADLLDKIAAHYQVSDYHSFRSVPNPCILRHDIDMSPALAVKLAEIEAARHMKATYFVLLNTGFYNIAFTDTLRHLEKIASLGHEIGLHFDEMQYNDCDSDTALKEHVYREADIMWRILGTPINVVSMHRPSKRTLESNYEFDGLINSYSKVFFDDFKYLSDSRMRWREDVEQIVNAREYKSIHILTHPFWYRDTDADIHNRLFNFINASVDERYEYVSNNVSDLHEIIKKEEILSLRNIYEH